MRQFGSTSALARPYRFTVQRQPFLVLTVNYRLSNNTEQAEAMVTVRLGVNVDDQLWLRLNPVPIPNCNPSANPSPSRNTNTNPNPYQPTTPLLTLTDPLTSK